MSNSLQRRDASGAVGRPLARLLETANREHERANQSAANAIEHAIRAGEALAKARDLCAAGEWSEFVAASFHGSMRTAQKYMRLARNIRTLQAQGPVAALTSQNEAAKALTTIIRGDSRSPPKDGLQKTRRARGASLRKSAAMLQEAISALGVLQAELEAVVPQTYHIRHAVSAVAEALRRIDGAAGTRDASAEPTNVDESATEQVELNVLPEGYDELP